jgi:SAM-dependent methyltransferase
MNERQSRALSMIDVARTRGLEIGPLDRPVVTKDMGQVAYVDHVTASALREKYDGDPGVNVDQIVDVDFVHSDRRLVACVEGDNFDYVVASHTIEHVPDVVGWLREVAEVLTEGGVLSLVIPDKGFTFDYLRPPSTPSDMIDSHLLGSRRPTFRQVYESLSKASGSYTPRSRPLKPPGGQPMESTSTPTAGSSPRSPSLTPSGS